MTGAPVKKILALGIIAAIPAAWAQHERQAVEVDLQAGAMRYKASGPGECKHAPRAGIYGVQAAMYMVSHRTGERSVRMTLWQPASGAVMVSLDIAEGPKRVSIDTVKGGAKKDTRGSAEVTVRKEGAGATFTLEGVAAGGEKVRGTLRCTAFGGIQAEGG